MWKLFFYFILNMFISLDYVFRYEKKEKRREKIEEKKRKIYNIYRVVFVIFFVCFVLGLIDWLIDWLIVHIQNENKNSVFFNFVFNQIELMYGKIF